MSDRVPVYSFDRGEDRVVVRRFWAGAPDEAAYRLFVALEDRGLHPHLTYQTGRSLITLLPGEVERLRELQRAEPQTFGGC